MACPNLDEATQKALDALPYSLVDGGICEPYNHEIIWYGMEALVHYVLMRRAQECVEGRQGIKAFMLENGVAFNQVAKLKIFTAPLQIAERDGIFVPKHAYGFQLRPNDRVECFSADYVNKIYSRDWPSEREYAVKLVREKRVWTPEDFKDEEIVNQGLQFSKDLWITCAKNFKEYVDMCKERGRPQPEEVTQLARKLIKYYTAVISK